MYTTISLSFASLAVLASNVVPSSASNLRPRVADINGFTYTSCQSAYDFIYVSPPFVPVDNSTSMTVELCTSECTAEYSFAALYGSQCFCGQNFTTFALDQDIQCNTPCPGNAKEICGGYFNVARGSEWYSLYSKVSSNTTTSSSSTTSGTSSISLSATRAYTTSTFYTTETYTITSCAAEVTNCPARKTTTVISSTIVYPIVTATLSLVSSPASTSTYISTTSAIVSTSTTVPGNSTFKATPTPSTTITPFSTSSTVPFTGAAASGRIERSGLLFFLAGLLAFL